MRLTSYIACGSILFAATLALAAEPPVILLWPNGAPGSEGKTGAETVRVQPAGHHVIGNVHQPSILECLPAHGVSRGGTFHSGSHPTVTLWASNQAAVPTSREQQ